MDELFTWANLTTIGSSSFLVFFMTSYFKSYFRWIPTDIFALFMSYIVLTLATIVTQPELIPRWETYILTLFNSFLVAAASSHIQQKALNPVRNKRNDDGSSVVSVQEQVKNRVKEEVTQEVKNEILSDPAIITPINKDPDKP